MARKPFSCGNRIPATGRPSIVRRMKILVANAIPYTSETPHIRRAPSIKDTMIYDLCLAFADAGHDVTLFLCDLFRPLAPETHPFRVVWAPCRWPGLFKPNVLPWCPSIGPFAERERFDLVIASEVFQLNSLALVRRCRGKLLVWQELAKHNRLFHEIPSRIWYGVIARTFFSRVPVVARSAQARSFISRYCKNVLDTVIDHGVNLAKFEACGGKERYFIVCSQLIARKRIDRIIEKFHAFSQRHPDWELRIFGEGDREAELRAQVSALGEEGRIKFFGKVGHRVLKEQLAKASAMLVYTERDLNMVSIVESIACGTPVVTTGVPYTAAYIRANALGIVDDSWDENDLEEIAARNSVYVANCLAYRPTLSTARKAETFVDLARKNLDCPGKDNGFQEGSRDSRGQ